MVNILLKCENPSSSSVATTFNEAQTVVVKGK